ncbi:MAG: hypothetical protein ACRDWX_01845 [Acidimicrobiia bacterium]
MAVDPGAAEVIDGIIAAYTGRQADRVLGYFSTEARVVGNLPHEDWSASDPAFRRYLDGELSAFTNLSWTFHGAAGLAPDHLVVGTQRHQVLVMEGELSGELHGQPFRHEGRWICVLEREDDEGGWLVKHSQFSLT